MTVRTIVLLIILLAFLFLLAVISPATNSVLLERFSELENHAVRRDALRGVITLSDELTEMSAFTWDYSAWIDTYEYVTTGNPEYLEANFFDGEFISQRLNLVIIADRGGEILYAKVVHEEQSKLVTASRQVKDFSARYGLLLQHETPESVITGIAEFDGFPMLVASRPVLQDYDTEPIGGTLIFGRFLDDAELAGLMEQVDFPVTFSLVDSATRTAGMVSAQSMLVAGSRPSETDFPVYPLDDEHTAAQFVASDINGEPVLLLTTVAPRSITIQGKATTSTILQLAGLVSVACAALSLLSMETMLIRPINQLITGAHYIAQHGRPAERMTVSGSKDLRRLAMSINEMLDALQRTQDELALSVAENRAILDAIPDIMLHIKPDGVVKWAVAPDGYEHGVLDSLAGKNVFELRGLLPVYSGADEANGLAALRAVLEDGQRQVVEILSEGTGVARDMEVRLSSLRAADGGVLALIRDITERRSAEMAERNAVLLKEIHHRVKNNLQVVISLLNLQALQAPSTEVAEMLRESQDRIRSMALIHEKLYGSRNLAQIEFAEYVRDLVDRLVNTYELAAHAVETDVIAQPMYLDIDSATSCGLIVSELVSNALKHAFIDRAKGKLSVCLECAEGGACAITVADDGVGLPASLDIGKTETLGLQLVTSLVRQIAGTLTFSRDQGTTFRIEFQPALPGVGGSGRGASHQEHTGQDAH